MYRSNNLSDRNFTVILLIQSKIFYLLALNSLNFYFQITKNIIPNMFNLNQGWANYGPREHSVRPANTF